MQTRLHVCAAVAAIVTALPNVYAGENLAPSIDGVSNGTSLKYNQNCLDIAYKNAYGEASGKPTSESDFKNYRCYVGKKVVPCTSMSEDGQTKKAEADYQTNVKLDAETFSPSIIGAKWPQLGGTSYGFTDAGHGSTNDHGLGAFYYWAGSDSFTKVDVVIDDYSKFSNTNQIEVVFNGKTAVLTKTKCTDYSDTVGNTQCEFKISGNPFDMTKNYSGELKVSIKNN